MEAGVIAFRDTVTHTFREDRDIVTHIHDSIE